MSRATKYKNGADLAAGLMVLIVAAALLLVAVYFIKQYMPQTQAPAGQSTAGPTTTLPTVPKPTLIPNPLDQNGFAYDQNGYLTCLTAESWLGVDVSEHQGQIQWAPVAEAGIQFAMVRLGYRGWGEEGAIRADVRGLENLQGAADAGLRVGVYFFSQAISVEEAIEEAQFVLQLLDGRQLDLPVVFDWETVSAEDARTANVKRSTLNACALAFCREIENAGYEAMVYFNLELAKWKLDLLAIQEAEFDFWLAMYSDSLRYAYQVRMWQYTDSGSVPGIKGKVDMDLYFPG